MISEKMQELLDCAEEVLTDAGVEPGRILLNPGAESVWDDCCAGQLWVRAGIVTPTVNGSRGNCGVTAIKVPLYLGILRCAAVVDAEGNAPPVEDMTADTVREMADMELLLKAINCCLTKTGMTVVNWNPLGVEGGCAGGEWQLELSFAVPGCDCP